MPTMLRNQFVVPIGLLLAFVAAVGVWFIPINPERRAAGRSTQQQAGWQQRIATSPTTAAQPAAAAATWNPPSATGLVEAAPTLASLRQPPPETPTIVENEEPTDDQAPEDTVAPPVITLEWEYQGSITSGETRAAMLYIAGRQRFIFEGELVSDPDNPDAEPVKIISITPTVVVAETRGVEIRLPLTSLTESQRAEVLAGADHATIGTIPRTIAPPRAADPNEVRRQRAAANRNPQARPNQPRNDAKTPQQPTVRSPLRTPTPPQREQPQRREK